MDNISEKRHLVSATLKPATLRLPIPLPPLELPFVGLEIARAHHLLDSFLRCSMALVRRIGTWIRP